MQDIARPPRMNGPDEQNCIWINFTCVPSTIVLATVTLYSFETKNRNVYSTHYLTAVLTLSFFPMSLYILYI